MENKRNLFVVFAVFWAISMAYVLGFAWNNEQTNASIIAKLKSDKKTLTAEKQSLCKTVAVLRELNTPPGVAQAHLRRVIQSTLNYLGEKEITAWTRLILLTIATESDLGRYLKQVKGPARGVVQIEPETERAVLGWFRSKRPDMYDKVKDLRIPARLSVHEAEYNMSYAVALCYGVYLMRKVQPREKNEEELARLYKKHYNTVLGKATVDGVLNKLDKYNVRL